MRIADSLLEIKMIHTTCESIHNTIILSQVEVDWFSSDAAKEVYTRIRTLMDMGKPIPSVSVLSCDQSLSDVARSILSPDKNNSLVSENDIRSAVELLRTHRNKRILAETFLTCLEKLGQSDSSVPNIITMVENVLLKCHTNNTTQEEIVNLGFTDRAKLLAEADEYLSDTNNLDVLPTGFGVFDKKTGGVRRKNVMVLASVPGGGKSAMALQMAIHQYAMGFNVCIVSYEMDESEIRGRLYANVSRVDHSEINLKRLNKAKKELILSKYGEWLESSQHGNKLSIWTPQRDLNLKQIALELKPRNFDIIYIDYLSLLAQNPKKQMWENLGDHTRDAKVAASSLNAAFVLLAQYDDQESKIKYSAAIKANANFVWVWDYGDKEKETGIIEVKQLKARNSTTYPFYLETDYSFFSFKDYMGPEPYNNFEDDDKTEIRRRKKKLDNKVVASKIENDKVIKDENKKETQQAQQEVVKRGIPKMPQLI